MSQHILKRTLVVISALLVIITLQQISHAAPLSIYGTTNWEGELNPRLGFLKVETFVDGSVDDVLLHYSPDDRFWRTVRMVHSANKRYVGVMPNNRHHSISYFVEVIGSQGDKIRDPLSDTYISSVPFKAIRKSIPKSQNYQGKASQTLHGSYNVGTFPVLRPLP